MSFDELAADFAREALRLISQLEAALLRLEALDPSEGEADALTALRVLHTLKGNAGLLGADRLSTTLHRLETLAGAGRDQVPVLLGAIDAVRLEVRRILEGGKAGEPSAGLIALEAALAAGTAEASAAGGFDLAPEVTVPQQRLDALVAAAGDLIIHNAQLQRGVARGASLAQLHARADRFDSAVKLMHELVLAVRTVPIGQLLVKCERLVRDEAKRQQKQVRLVIDGERTEADKAVLDLLAGVLAHLVRNAIVHGLEPAEERIANGKSPEGRLTLSAHSAGDRFLLFVEDDGRGLDREAIAARAGAMGLDPQAEAEALIFAPRLSTASLTEAAGRGVGLDAVRRTVLSIGGTIGVWTLPGLGTRFTLTIPSSIAVQRAVLCEISGETFALPLTAILETVRLDRSRVRWLGHGQALEHRGALVPLIDTRAALGTRQDTAAYAVFLSSTSVAALPVDALLDQQDFVFHALEKRIAGNAPISGAALLSDGRVVLRLNPEPLVKSATEARA
ncbi:MAG: chemotaxis protein CheA [Myxococcaceae bacterium]|nr:chemotaxis protein CheA [Myxococcaceae bacterium]